MRRLDDREPPPLLHRGQQMHPGAGEHLELRAVVTWPSSTTASSSPSAARCCSSCGPHHPDPIGEVQPGVRAPQRRHRLRARARPACGAPAGSASPAAVRRSRGAARAAAPAGVPFQAIVTSRPDTEVDELAAGDLADGDVAAAAVDPDGDPRLHPPAGTGAGRPTGSTTARGARGAPGPSPGRGS